MKLRIFHHRYDVRGELALASVDNNFLPPFMNWLFHSPKYVAVCQEHHEDYDDFHDS